MTPDTEAAVKLARQDFRREDYRAPRIGASEFRDAYIAEWERLDIRRAEAGY